MAPTKPKGKCARTKSKPTHLHTTLLELRQARREFLRAIRRATTDHVVYYLQQCETNAATQQVLAGAVQFGRDVAQMEASAAKVDQHETDFVQRFSGSLLDKTVPESSDDNESSSSSDSE